MQNSSPVHRIENRSHVDRDMYQQEVCACAVHVHLSGRSPDFPNFKFNRKRSFCSSNAAVIAKKKFGLILEVDLPALVFSVKSSAAVINTINSKEANHAGEI